MVYTCCTLIAFPSLLLIWRKHDVVLSSGNKSLGDSSRKGLVILTSPILSISNVYNQGVTLACFELSFHIWKRECKTVTRETVSAPAFKLLLHVATLAPTRHGCLSKLSNIWPFYQLGLLGYWLAHYAARLRRPWRSVAQLVSVLTLYLSLFSVLL